jgi:hypothetical protein
LRIFVESKPHNPTFLRFTFPKNLYHPTGNPFSKSTITKKPHCPPELFREKRFSSVNMKNLEGYPGFE